MNDSVIPNAAMLVRLHNSRWGAEARQHAPELLDALYEAREAAVDGMQGLDSTAGGAPLTASQQRRWDAFERARDECEAAITTAEADARAEREVRAQRVNESRARWGSVHTGSFGDQRGPWQDVDRGDSPEGWVRRGHDVIERDDSGLSARTRERLATAMAERHGHEAAQFIVARSDPSYLSAFQKVITAPDPSRAFFSFTPDEMRAFSFVESVRASLSTNVGTGGYLIPLSLDPNVAAIANDGAASPFRTLCTVRTTPTSPFRTVTSAGVTASWVAENTAIGDASPTFAGVDIPLYKLAALVTSSYELFADAGAALLENLSTLLADARDVAEAAAFVSGNGTSAPTGIITAISATAGCTVTATTRGSFTSASAVDTFALLNGLPARARQSPSVASFMNNTTITTVRQQIAGTGGVALTDMSAAVPSVLGVPFHEASSVTASTVSGSILGVAGDMSKYMIVDHVQGPSLEFVQNVVDSSGVPTGTRGWVYWARTGGDSLDDARFRFLKA